MADTGVTPRDPAHRHTMTRMLRTRMMRGAPSQAVTLPVGLTVSAANEEGRMNEGRRTGRGRYTLGEEREMCVRMRRGIGAMRAGVARVGRRKTGKETVGGRTIGAMRPGGRLSGEAHGSGGETTSGSLAGASQRVGRGGWWRVAPLCGARRAREFKLRASGQRSQMGASEGCSPRTGAHVSLRW